MNPYERLGVKQYINAAATLTAFGGSIMPPEVLEAMGEASKSYVSIVDLQFKAGAYLASLTGNEAAMVSNGAAAGMVLATAACIAGDDAEKRGKLPYTDGMANEILVCACSRVGYDFALRQAGGKIVEYGDKNGATAQQLEEAITDKTAAIFIFYFEHKMDKQVPVEVQVSIAGRHGIPVIVDAAAQLPLRENLHRFTRDWGVDAAIFSGGKGLCGPQSSGLVVGKKELVHRMISFGCPNNGIGRPMKVGKEEIMGLVKAVELYMQRDMEQEQLSFERQVQMVIDAFSEDSSVQVTQDFPSEAGQPMPRAKLTLVPGVFRVDAQDINEQLKQGNPGVLCAADSDSLLINPQTLQLGDIEIVIARLKQTLSQNLK